MAIDPDKSREESDIRRELEAGKAEQRSIERNMTAAERTAQRNEEARRNSRQRADEREEKKRTDARNSLIDAVLQVQPSLQRSDVEPIFRPPPVSERPPAHVPSSADGGKTKIVTINVWMLDKNLEPKKIAVAVQ